MDFQSFPTIVDPATPPAIGLTRAEAIEALGRLDEAISGLTGDERVVLRMELTEVGDLLSLRTFPGLAAGDG